MRALISAHPVVGLRVTPIDVALLCLGRDAHPPRDASKLSALNVDATTSALGTGRNQ